MGDTIQVMWRSRNKRLTATAVEAKLQGADVQETVKHGWSFPQRRYLSDCI